MQVFLSIRVRGPLTETIPEEEIYTRLTSLGVTQGIDIPAIRRSIEAASRHGMSQKRVPIAQGVPPKAQCPGYYIFAPKLRALDPVFRQDRDCGPNEKPDRRPDSVEGAGISPSQGSDSGGVSDPQRGLRSAPESQSTSGTFAGESPVGDSGRVSNSHAAHPSKPESQSSGGPVGHSASGTGKSTPEKSTPGKGPDYSEPVSIHNRVDYREIQSYLVVSRGEILAIWKQPTPGEPGYDVRGRQVTLPNQTITTLEPGEGTRVEGGRVYAEVTGKLSWNAKSFFVETTIRIKGNIDYRVGNIRFPGNLILEGEVRDRFKVWIGGTLDCLHGLDVHQIMTGGAVTVKEGIIGHGRGLLRTKSRVSARHVENCTIEALGDVVLEKACYNSRVYTRGSVILPKGRIVGGQVKTRDTISAGVVGNVAESVTELVLGIDFVVERMVDHYNTRQQAIRSARRELAREARVGRIREQRAEKRFAQLMEEEEYNNEQLIRLLPLLDVNDMAALEVHDTIYPGVRLRICSLQFTPTKPLKAVRFFIDKANGIISYEKLARS